MKKKVVRPLNLLKSFPDLKECIEHIDFQTKHLSDKEYIDWLKEKRERADRGYSNIVIKDQKTFHVYQRLIVDKLIENNKLTIKSDSNHPLYKEYKQYIDNLLNHQILTYQLEEKENKKLISDVVKNNGIFSIYQLKDIKIVSKSRDGNSYFEEAYFILNSKNGGYQKKIKLSSFILPLKTIGLFDSQEFSPSTFEGERLNGYFELYEKLKSLKDQLVLITNEWTCVGPKGLIDCINLVPLPDKEEISKTIKKEFIRERIRMLNALVYNPSTLLNFYPVDALLLKEVLKENKKKLEDKLKKILKKIFTVQDFCYGTAIVGEMFGRSKGFIDSYGKYILKPEYNRIERVSTKLLSVAKEGKHALFTYQGHQLTDFKFQNIHKFNNDIALVELDDRYSFGFINQYGEFVSEPMYGNFCYEEDDCYLIKRGNNRVYHVYNIFGKNGKLKSSFEVHEDYSRFEGRVTKGLFKFSDLDFARKINYPITYVYANVEGVIFDRVGDLIEDMRVAMRSSKWYFELNYYNAYGYLNKKGELKIPTQFSKARDFVGNKALVTTWDPDTSERKHFFIDKNGNRLNELFPYDSISDFSNGFYQVKLNEKWGYINEKGEEVIPPKYSKIYEFKHGIAVVSIKKDLYGINDLYAIINTDGEELCDFKYTKIGNFNNGVARAEYQDIHSFYPNLYFLHKSGKELTQCYIFIGDFKNGYAKVRDLKEKYGFINRLYKEIIPCQFDEVHDFNSEGEAEVCLKQYGDWHLIDKDGNKIRELGYRYDEPPSPYTDRDALRDAYGDILPEGYFNGDID